MYDYDKYGYIEALDFFHYDVSPSIKHKFWQDVPDIMPFDVETTGRYPVDHENFRIVQFTAAYFNRPDKGHRGIHEPDKFFNWFIDPEMAVPEGAMEIHGLYHSDYNDDDVIEQHGTHDLKGYPTFEEVCDPIVSCMMDSQLWAAFKHTFDLSALASEMMRIGRDPIFRTTLDPLHWERHRKGTMSGNTLWQIAKRFGVATVSQLADGDGALHDARTDIQLLNDVMWKMASGLPAKTYDTVRRQKYLLKEHSEYYWKKYGTPDPTS